jgi:hypothetical protein
VERAAGRVPKLDGGENYKTKVTFSALISAEEVETAAGSIKTLQRADPDVQISPPEIK